MKAVLFKLFKLKEIYGESCEFQCQLKKYISDFGLNERCVLRVCDLLD